MMTAPYALGIDLGTTNSVLAYCPLGQERPEVGLLPIPQLVAHGTLESHTMLPSFLYLASRHELGPGSLDLPWQSGRDFAVGEMARRQAADVPDRTVGGAKSWLCHTRVDRRHPILPWHAPEEVEKVSPVTASRRYLEHLVAAWHARFPEAPFHQQQIVLTVPASFDASARELTREAALAAGFPQEFRLLEEPQAALYAWLADEGDRWRRRLTPGDTLLVCDIGGGTTDLTLVRATEDQGQLALERIAVGNHLLIGGDNMDLALAHHVAGMFAERGIALDAWQSVSLWHACRTAKETLLAAEGPERHTISVLGRGSRLIGGTVSVDVDRETLARLFLDGFFPTCAADARPARRRASGFQELGLPFEADPAVTRHLAAFLGAHAGQDGPAVRPSRVLFNGGVFKSDLLRDRMLEVLGSWYGPLQLLSEAHDLDHAVARGAAYYAWCRQRGGMRIRGGTARAYYVGIETAGLAVPGAQRPLHALCVAPIGMEEGTEVEVPSAEIGLVVGETAQFRFFCSAVRKQDHAGTWLTTWSREELTETDGLEATLPADDQARSGFGHEYVPVRFESRLTELGVLELWCVSVQGDRRWKLQFSVRDEAEA